jgi:long-chain fatty acid transport protein
MAMIGKKLMTLAVAAALGGLASSAVAGGFGIGTQSGSGTGNAFAGGAAVADDASVVWSNPAGMSLLPSGKQVTGALHVLKPSFKFQDTASTATATGEGGDGGDWAFVPNGFFKMDIDSKLRFGLALNVPFGLKTDYDAGWRGRFLAIKSEIKTINVNPSVAYKISDTVSIGGGVSVQKIDAELSQNAGAPGKLTLNADDIGYGFNIGLMVQTAKDTRIGMSYRSSIKYELEGTGMFNGAPGDNGNVRADLKVPDSASISVLHQLNAKWELMGDITWTGWSTVKQLVVTFTSGPLAPGSLPTLPFNWKDTWRFGVGANYRMNDQTKIRFGVALDETPTNDVDRTPRLPDQDRTWVAIGVQHRISKSGVLDVGYAHEFIRDASVNQSMGLAGTLVGKFENKADIFSIQYSHSY